MNNLLFKFAIFIFALSVSVFGMFEETTEEILEANFKSFTVKDGAVFIEMNDIGRRYVYEPADKTAARVLVYGEKIELPVGFEKALLYSRGVSIKLFKTEEAKNIYQMNLFVDMPTSLGHEIKIERRFIIHENSIEDIPPEPKVKPFELKSSSDSKSDSSADSRPDASTGAPNQSPPSEPRPEILDSEPTEHLTNVDGNKEAINSYRYIVYIIALFVIILCSVFFFVRWKNK